MQSQLPQGKKIKFCLYARKSCERDELQALSIDSQVKEMMEIAKRDDLVVADIRKESHSAKDSGERPVFKTMIDDIKLDKIQGILTWAPDRLSRNAGDLGVMVDLMDQKYLIEIRTYNQIFTNSPNDKFLLMILGSQAKLENDNKAVNVKRGLKAKCEMGFRPGVTPLGYLNDKGGDKGQKRVYLDSEKAPIIKEIFLRTANGESGRSILRWLGSTGFTTRTGIKVVLSSLYAILNNPYYCGKFEYPIGTNKWYKVNHESIISEELFQQVKERLAIAPKAKPGTKVFNFTKILKCGACGSGVTAEEKFRSLVDGGKHRFIYYHCTGARNRDCKQPYIREEYLVEQFEQLIDKLDASKFGTRKQLHNEIQRYEKFTNGILGQEIDTKISKVDIKKYAKYVLKNGTREEKRELLYGIKTKIFLKDQMVYTT
ncbi:MAG: recombinase [Candidatus Berkelbacteria bacterium]|nr:recombinase [Candidatus Berkelbacteria bacterium]